MKRRLIQVAAALAVTVFASGVSQPAEAATKKKRKPAKQKIVAQNAAGVYQFPKRTVKWTTPAPASFVPCFEALDCALVETPMNYADPLSPALEIAVVRRKASDPANRVGVLFVNPGGPGASASGLIRAAQRIFPADLLARFDLVGVDPRGTTNSAPVSCGIDPLVEAEINTNREAIQAIANACGKQSGQLLRFVDSESAARDHDWVRQAMGEAQVSFLGYSYGGYLGALYAQLFPTTLRAVILDSGLDHTRFGTGLLREGFAAQERSLRTFLQQCQDGTFAPCVFNDGTDLLAKFDRVIGFYGDPAQQSSRRQQNRVNFEQIVETFLQTKSAGGWTKLAEGLNKAAVNGGDPVRAFDLTSLNNPRSFEVLESIFAYQCRDGFMTQDAAQMQSLSVEVPTVAPHFQVSARLSTELYQICQFWPQRTKTPPPITPNGVAPILLIGATLDSITPIEWQQSMVTTTGGTLLTRVGADHGQVGRSKCVDAAAVAFLVGLTMPAAGTVCND